MYKRLLENKAAILAEARKAADEIGIPKEIRGKFGLGKGLSSTPAPLRRDVLEAVVAANREIVTLDVLVDQLRDLVKDVYGDEYDAAATSTGEAALWLLFDVLATPPMEGRGSNYRARYIAPYERHMHHQAAYGRPFPGRYKDLSADRGVTAGELGLQGKRLDNLDCVHVPLVGAKYDVYGIKYHPCPLLTRVDPDTSIQRMKKVAEIHASMLTAFASLAYDTPGYGYGVKDEDGAPRLQKLIGKLASEYCVPYIADNAGGLPFVGTDLRKTGVDVMMYSGDKAIPALCNGLIIGKEDVMVPVRRALGMHGNRWGTLASYGKAAYVIFDPGKSGIAALIAALKILKDEPEKLTVYADSLYKIVKEEFAEINPRLKEGIIITKSANRNGVEVNYEQTWKEGKLGIPIFSIEDLYAGTCLITSALREMGIRGTICYDANIAIAAGMGTIDEEGLLMEERMRYAVKGLVRVLEILCKYAGVLE